MVGYDEVSGWRQREEQVNRGDFVSLLPATSEARTRLRLAHAPPVPAIGLTTAEARRQEES